MSERFRNSGREKRKEEFTLHIEHGDESIFQVEVSPIVDWRKRLVGRVFVGREITESKKLELLLRNMASELEERVRERTHDLAEAYDTTLEGWAHALELRDKETEGHSRNVTELATRLAVLMNIPEDELVHLRRGALLHDIGKMGIPDIRPSSAIRSSVVRFISYLQPLVHRKMETNLRSLLENIGFSNNEFQNKVIVITGAAHGIGLQIARAFAMLGGKVVIAELSEEGKSAAEWICAEAGEASFIQTDVSDAVSVAHLAQETHGQFGPVDIIINNAIRCPVARVAEMDEKLWDQVIAVNLRGTFLVSKAFLPDMLARKVA